MIFSSSLVFQGLILCIFEDATFCQIMHESRMLCALTVLMFEIIFLKKHHPYSHESNFIIEFYYKWLIFIKVIFRLLI